MPDDAGLFIIIMKTTETLISDNSNILVYNVPDNLGDVETDEMRLRQIFFNLISNAAKFTSNGKITISIERLTDTLKIFVTDTGIGMTEEQLEDLTTPFVQGDASTTREYGGTGLGMSITNHLTNLLNINFDVTSTPGKGTQCVLTIPYKFYSGNLK